jgi:hypothetical protein
VSAAAAIAAADGRSVRSTTGRSGATTLRTFVVEAVRRVVVDRQRVGQPVGDAGRLGAVHRLVGGADQIVERGTVAGVQSGPDAPRDGDVGEDRGAGEAGADPFRAVAHRGPLLETGEQDHELVAAPATDDIGVAHGVVQAASAFDQHLVAGVVPTGVVDRLEPVEVDEHHAQTGAETIGVDHRLLALPLELAAVEETGHLIGRRPPLERTPLGESRPDRDGEQDRPEREQ